jgi:teichuronic acid biosynthesis glycosyltransferase TuaC
MYPNKANYNSGTFIHNQIRSLGKKDCLINVISPIPYSPKVLRFRPRWTSYGLIPEHEVIDGISVYYPRYLRLPGKRFHGLSCYSMTWGIEKSMHSIITEFRPHAIHAHMATPVGYVGLILKKKYHLPLICSLRGSDVHTYPNFGRLSMHLTAKVLSETDQLVSVSSALKTEVETIAKPKEEIKVVYNGCDINAFKFNGRDRNAIRNKMQLSAQDKVIIFVGGIVRSKGIYELVNAFINLVNKYKHLHLIILGNGPEYTTIKNIAFFKGLTNKIHLAGNIPHDEISQWLSASDIFVLPSYNEGLPNAVLEAMACSLPVVATKVGGIPEAIEDGQSGMLILKEDTDSLRKAICHLLNNEELAKQMGRNGRRIVEQQFSWPKNAEKMLQIYGEVIGR